MTENLDIPIPTFRLPISAQSVWTFLVAVGALAGAYFGLPSHLEAAFVQAAGLVVGGHVLGLHVRKSQASKASTAPPAR